MDPFVAGTRWEDPEELVRAVPIARKTIDRWRIPETQKPNFKRLAELIGVEREALKAAHKVAWDARARAQAENAHQQPKKDAVIDRRGLLAAILAVESDRFASLLIDSADVDDIEAVSVLLADLIKRADTDELVLVLNRAIEQFRVHAVCDELNALNQLRGLYRAVLRVSSVRLPKTEEDGSAKRRYVATGIQHPFPLIFAVDATRRVRRGDRLQVLAKDKLDDSVDVTGCVHLKDLGGGSAMERAHQCVRKLGEQFPEVSQPFPEFNDPNREVLFKTYLRTLDGVLFDSNNSSNYFLALIDEDTPTDALPYLAEWLHNLHMFECIEPDAMSSNLMHGRHNDLAAWYTRGLWTLDDQIVRIKQRCSEEQKALVPDPEAPAQDLAKSTLTERADTAITLLKKTREGGRVVRDMISDWVPKWSKAEQKEESDD